jgi:hypothetical protein
MLCIANGLLVEYPEDRPPPASAIPVKVADKTHFLQYRHLYKVRGRRLVPPTKAEIEAHEQLRFSVEEVRALKELAQRYLAEKA